MVSTIDRLTLKDVAQEIGRSLEQVRRYVREGKLPAEKLGMQWFVERQDLEAFKGQAGKPQQDVLARARSLRESIERRVGRLDVVDLVSESRGRHP